MLQFNMECTIFSDLVENVYVNESNVCVSFVLENFDFEFELED